MADDNEYGRMLMRCTSALEAAEVLRRLPSEWKRSRRQLLVRDGVEDRFWFESLTWELGEGLRQALLKKKAWRSSPELLAAVTEVVLDGELLHGRQPFYALLAKYGNDTHVPPILSAIGDTSVQGQVVEALRLLGFGGACEQVSQIKDSTKYAWVRREAKKYLAKFDGNG